MRLVVEVQLSLGFLDVLSTMLLLVNQQLLLMMQDELDELLLAEVKKMVLVEHLCSAIYCFI